MITLNNRVIYMLNVPAYTYSVASNPVFQEHGDLHVLFSGDSQTKPQHKLGPKVYDYYLLHHVESGQGRYTTEYDTYSLQAGDSFLILPEQLVHYESDAEQPWHYRWVAFTGSHAEKLVQYAGFSSQAPIAKMNHSHAVLQWMQLIQQAFQGQRHSSHLQAIGYLHLILAEHSEVLKQEENSPDSGIEMQKTVKQMIRYMSTQYAQPITMEQMAESLGYNRAYLSRIFKQATEMTPVTFLLKLRIDKGRQLLRERTELTVEQIAASVGFQDALYFSRQFKRFYEQSPTEYRAQVTQV